MKNILLILLFVTSLFSEDGFLEPDQAFITTVTQNDSGVEFKIVLDKTIYLYDEFIKVSIKEPKLVDITKELAIVEPVEYDGFQVHFKELVISVPQSLIDDKIGAGNNYTLEFAYQGCSKAGLCYSPMSKEYKSDIKTSTATAEQTPPAQTKKAVSEPVNETDAIAQTLKDGSILLVLATFFGFGLLLAMTPCIFPMIPILSGIIVKQSNQAGGQMSAGRGFFLSLVYVLSMAAAYTLAGVLAGVFGANIQAMLQNPYVIVAFVGIFIALAFSMFGYYEIGLPASWQSKLNKTSDESSKKGGLLGIAIMGFISALIVGPCVAPPLAGALVYIGQTGDAVLGGLALFVMSMGMGMPLLAIGIGAGKYMPKPGGWMTTVSKVFGVVMLGVAIWMLDRIVPFIVTTILIMILAMGSAFYLIKNGNKFGKIVAIVLMVASSYFLMQTMTAKEDKLQYTYVKTVEEFDKVVAHSAKPVMIDFWATWCVSCIELDNITFKDPVVREELKKYLLVKVDVTKNTSDDKALMKKFNLFGPPALIFYKDGEEQKSKRIIGFKNAEDFLKIVK
jgi:thiol:disulfide interchange protein DsbD